MNEIVRSSVKAHGGITEEEKRKMALLCEKWKEIAFKTMPIDREKITAAIKGLYRVSGLKEPRIVIVPSPFVMAIAYGLSAGWWYLKKNIKNDATLAATRAATLAATGAATSDATLAATRAAIRAATRAATRDAIRAATDDATGAATLDATDAATRDATRDAIRAATDDATRDATRAAIRAATLDATDAATLDATRDATRAATRAAIRAATRDATFAATRAATRDAIRAATDDATFAATRAATRDAIRAATDDATDDATRAATDDATDDAIRDAINVENKMKWLKDLAFLFGGKNYKFLLNCISRWFNAYQGGNMWAGWQAYIDAMENVIGLNDLECFKKHKFYMDCAIYGGFRVMHEEFCIVSDFPEILKIDKQNRPFCEDGPTHRWRDGFEIYHLNGVRVPKYLVMTPKNKLSVEFFKKETNADIKAEFIRKYGIERMVFLGKVIDSITDESDEWYKKSEYQLIDMGKVYDIPYAPHLKMKNLTTGIYHLEGVSPDCKTVNDAIKFRCDGKQIEIAGIK